MKRVYKAIVMIALALSLGLHWVVLQSVAWAGMFVDYSADHGLVVAIDKTFDADNKCGLCRFVEDGTQAEAEADSDYVVKLTKLDGCARTDSLVLGVPALLEVPLVDRVALAMKTAFSPLSPPPRA